MSRVFHTFPNNFRWERARRFRAVIPRSAEAAAGRFPALRDVPPSWPDKHRPVLQYGDYIPLIIRIITPIIKNVKRGCRK